MRNLLGGQVSAGPPSLAPFAVTGPGSKPPDGSSSAVSADTSFEVLGRLSGRPKLFSEPYTFRWHLSSRGESAPEKRSRLLRELPTNQNETVSSFTSAGRRLMLLTATSAAAAAEPAWLSGATSTVSAVPAVPVASSTATATASLPGLDGARFSPVRVFYVFVPAIFPKLPVCTVSPLAAVTGSLPLGVTAPLTLACFTTRPTLACASSSPAITAYQTNAAGSGRPPGARRFSRSPQVDGERKGVPPPGLKWRSLRSGAVWRPARDEPEPGRRGEFYAPVVPETQSPRGPLSESSCNSLVLGGLAGAARRSRTPNLQIRSLSLYPVELWLHVPDVREEEL
jgi:hypothetical protein